MSSLVANSISVLGLSLSLQNGANFLDQGENRIVHLNVTDEARNTGVVSFNNGRRNFKFMFLDGRLDKILSVQDGEPQLIDFRYDPAGELIGIQVGVKF